MAISLDHTIIYAKDKEASADFLANILGLPAPEAAGPFSVVRVGSLSLDFMQDTRPIQSRHLAFSVSEKEFDEIFERIQIRGLEYWADPNKQSPNEINHWNGGRGFYWHDPDGHFYEVLTRSYYSD